MRMTKYIQNKFFRGMMVIGLMMVGSASYAQNELLFDDFSNDLSNWQELGNPGNPHIVDGELVLDWGYAPNWFVTQETFNFGSEAIRVDLTFVGGGHQASSNFKQNYVQPILGATSIEDGGAVRSRFSADFFELERSEIDDDGNVVWNDIPFVGDDDSTAIVPGSRLRFEIAPSAQEGELFVNDVSVAKFMTEPVMEGGFGFRVVTDTRDIIVDDVSIAQIDAEGNETVAFEDDFERADLGDAWVNETIGPDSSPGPLSATIVDGQLHLNNDGAGDAWLRTAESLSYIEQTTIFEYTFVGFIEGSNYLPTTILGAQPYESGATNGTILVDAGTGFNYGMVDGGWAAGQAFALGNNRQGMRFKIVIDEGGQSGTVYRDEVEGLNFINIGPQLSGGFAFRTIVDRDVTIDDVRIYTLEDDGSETTIFEDDFERDEIGDNWVTESITPNVPPGAQFAYIDDMDDDGDNELFLDHDDTTDDAWFRLTQDLPFGEGKPVVIEGTYVTFNAYASVVVGTEEWVANQIVGPILIDNLGTPWVMDTRGGNVWVRPGPIGGATLSYIVNADGRSGSFLVNDVIVREFEFAEGEAPIPAGFIGLEDPHTSPQANSSPPAEPDTTASAQYDNFRVTQLDTTAIQTWMLH